MIFFKADIRHATAATDDAITTSSVGIPVSLGLASDFDGLSKTVVFKAGSVSVDIALIGDADSTTVPPDVLIEKGKYLSIGIYAADGNGTIVIPTVWAVAGLIQEGTVPSGVDPTEPTPNWVAQVQNIASEANENAASALEKATAVETAAENGEFDGQDGSDGTDGVSPVVSVTEITGGHRVTITDATGTKTFDVMNGERGEQGNIGPQGSPGEDGFSPIVTVEEITSGHRVTITDETGDHVFDVMDGQGGSGSSDYAELTNKPSIEGVTLSGNKTAAELGLAKSSDIPSVPVQSVNGKTGSVVLSASDVGAKPSSYTAPVDSVNGKTGAVVLDAEDVGALPDDTVIPDAVTEQTVAGWGFTKNTGTYSKPSGGIPKSDLASDVQTSLGKADTALQQHQSLSGYATESWVQQQGYLTQHQSLSAYRTAAAQDVIDATKVDTSDYDPATKTEDMTQAVGVDQSGKLWTKPGGERAWQILYEGTTTEEAIIRIPITGISVKAIKVYCLAPAYANDFTLYAPLMQTSGSHYDVSGYMRMMLGVSKSTTAKRLARLEFDSEVDVPFPGTSSFEFHSIHMGSSAKVDRKNGNEANMTPGMTITALSVATYQNTPAGTQILVIGR